MASQDTSNTLFHLRCQILRQKKHTTVCQNSHGRCALVFPAASVLAAKVRGWFYLSAGEMDHPLLNSRRGGGGVTYEGNRSTPGGTRAIYLEKAAPDTLNQVPTALSLSQHLAAK